MPETTIRLKVCVGCKKEVPRQDCHRNRYGEYICKDCQAAGLKYTWRHALTGQLKIGAKKYRVWAAYVLVGLLAVGVFYMVLDRFAGTPGPSTQE